MEVLSGEVIFNNDNEILLENVPIGQKNITLRRKLGIEPIPEERTLHATVPNFTLGTLSLAVCAAIAAKLQKKDDIGVGYIGDGAVEEGVVHESFNFAKIQKAPMLFVIENNLFASHMHISLGKQSDFISRFATANNIPYKLVDGNNVIEVMKASKELIDNIRLGRGPALI